MENADLWSAISISGRLVTQGALVRIVPASHAAAIFSKSARDSPIIMRFLDSWLHGASAGYRVG